MKHKSINKDLFVSDLSFEVTEEDLQKLFAVCGEVRAVHMMNDRRTGKFNGCAFIRMATAAEAKDALVTLDGARLLNRCISVGAAQAKKVVDAPVAPPAEKPKRPKRPRRTRQ